MNKLRFICSYIVVALKSGFTTCLLIFLSTVVGGYVSTLMYGIMKAEVGDVGRMFVPTYAVAGSGEAVSQYGKGTAVMIPLFDILSGYDALFGRESDAENPKYVTFTVEYGNSGDPIFGRQLSLSWDTDIFGKTAIEDGRSVAVLPQVLADGFGWKEGDTVTAFGAEFRAIGFSDEISTITIPYSCVVEDVTVERYSLSFIPNRKLSDTDADMLSAYVPNDRYFEATVYPQYTMPYVFIIVTVVCSLNTLVSAVYIMKRAAGKYSVAKILGASNALTAIAMLCELGVYTLFGAVVGYVAAALSFYGLGIASVMRFSLSVGDGAIVLAANVVTTLAVCAYSVVKRALKVPCEK